MLDKKTIIEKFAKSSKDVGSVEVQIGLLAQRITTLSGHLKSFPKDRHSQVGLLKMVGKKRRLENYLQREDVASFEKVMKQLQSK